MSREEAWWHLPLLLFFYSVEYALLDRTDPTLAPWLALAFGAILHGVYLLVRGTLERGPLESEAVVHAFTAVVLGHAVFFQLVTPELRPWIGLLSLLALPLLAAYGEPAARHAPYVGLILFASGCGAWRALWGQGLSPHEAVALNLAFGATFLAAFEFSTGKVKGLAPDTAGMLDIGLLAAANLQMLTGLGRLADQVYHAGTAPAAFLTTTLWALWGLAAMGLAWTFTERPLARASVGVLALSAGKLLLFDVSNNEPMVRILCLLFMGGVLYASGYLLRVLEERLSAKGT